MKLDNILANPQLLGKEVCCKLMEYEKYMSKAMFEKSLNTLIGIIKGIKADQIIRTEEMEELQNWCLLQSKHISKFPFNEIIPIVRSSIEDGFLSEEEIEDILWVCSLYTEKNKHFDAITSDIHILHGILHGIVSDNRIDERELIYLKNWLHNNEHLETIYPYDEIFALLHHVMKDGKVDEEEQKLLKVFFSDFIDTKTSYNINLGEIEQLKKEISINGICALGPNIEIEGKTFCFTGESSKMKRSDIELVIIENGGKYNDRITKKTDYLIIGDMGNPCWAFSCYGRKVEKAVTLRKQGHPIIIAHEVDFWDAIA